MSNFDKNKTFEQNENMICSENLIKYKGKNIELDPNNHENVIFEGKSLSKSTFLNNYVRKYPDKFDFSEFNQNI